MVGDDAAELAEHLGNKVFKRVIIDEIVGVIRAEALLAGGGADHDDGVERRGEVDAVALVDLGVIRDLVAFAVQKSLNAALFGIGIRGDETLLELIGFHIHIGKRLAEFIELIAVVVAGGLFNVVVVENLDGRGKPCAGAERNEHADAEHEDADKQRDDGELGETAENVGVRHDVEDRKTGGIRLCVGDERFGAVGACVGERAGGIGELREILNRNIGGLCVREPGGIALGDVGGENLVVAVQQNDLLEAA